MFPLQVPLNFLRGRAKQAQVVVDPFCGRGTTLFAARLRGVRAIGIDCSPVAIAISRAKLADFSVEEALELACQLLSTDEPDVPSGEFWSLAYHPNTLRDVCRLRDGLRKAGDGHPAIVLRAATLGVLHGPITGVGSYLSNQMQRTFAPKPGYAVKFWKQRRLSAPQMNVLSALERKLRRIGESFQGQGGTPREDVHLADSSEPRVKALLPEGIDAVVTSPPYYGMRTYVPDQWLRHWFLGGPASVDYVTKGDLPSSSPDAFAAGLAQTWSNIASRAAPGMKMLIRFGAIPSKAIDARSLLLKSLQNSEAAWRVISIRNAKSASAGKRQARHMRSHVAAIDEFDFHVGFEG